MPSEVQKTVEIIVAGFLEVSLKWGLKEREDFHRKRISRDRRNQMGNGMKMGKHKTHRDLKASGF